jgi:uncharacterized protein YfdQ (DUF2303 family)
MASSTTGGTPVPSKPGTVVENVGATIAREVKALHGVELHHINDLTAEGGTIAVLPEGKRIEDLKPILDRYLKQPDRRQGTATLTDAASFIAHLKRFASEDSAVFASPTRSAPKLTVVFDYHPSNSNTTDAAFMGHRATYAPALSDPWNAWSGKNGASMTQVDFAAFIEEHITDVIVPNFDDPNLKTFADLVQGRFASPSDLLAMSRGLAVNVETTVKNAVQLNTGIINVQFEETHRDGLGQPIQIANLFQITIPVFYGGTPYRIAVRLRYRLAGGKIVWSYLLVRPDLVFDDAFKGIVKQVVDETEVPVFLGAPEQ